MKIVRSKRKTISLTVTDDGEILVRAPLRASDDYINEFVSRHRDWIKKRREKVSSRRTLDLSDGAVVTLFGTDYIVQTGRARIADGKFFLPEENRERAFIRVLKPFALDVMRILTAQIARRYSFREGVVRVSSARSRWGSCNAKFTISYSFRIAFLPPELVEYIAVHELSHTVHLNHSGAFWNTVESVLPDWKARRKALKSYEDVMFWL